MISSRIARMVSPGWTISAARHPKCGENLFLFFFFLVIVAIAEKKFSPKLIMRTELYPERLLVSSVAIFGRKRSEISRNRVVPFLLSVLFFLLISREWRSVEVAVP